MSDITSDKELYQLIVQGYFWSPSDARYMEKNLQAVLDGKAKIVFYDEEEQEN